VVRDGRGILMARAGGGDAECAVCIYWESQGNLKTERVVQLSSLTRGPSRGVQITCLPLMQIRKPYGIDCLKLAFAPSSAFSRHMHTLLRWNGTYFSPFVAWRSITRALGSVKIQ
jgi:hypothetical protein